MANTPGTHTMKKLSIATASLLLAGSAWAQVTVTGVQGLITATQGNLLFNVTNGMTLPEGTQLQLTTGAQATVNFPNGCSATLGAGQSMLLTPENCQRLAAVPLPQPAVFGGGWSTPLVIGSGLLGVAALRALSNTAPATPTPISPS